MEGSSRAVSVSSNSSSSSSDSSSDSEFGRVRASASVLERLRAPEKKTVTPLGDVSGTPRGYAPEVPHGGVLVAPRRDDLEVPLGQEFAVGPVHGENRAVQSEDDPVAGLEHPVAAEPAGKDVPVSLSSDLPVAACGDVRDQSQQHADPNLVLGEGPDVLHEGPPVAPSGHVLAARGNQALPERLAARVIQSISESILDEALRGPSSISLALPLPWEGSEPFVVGVMGKQSWPALLPRLPRDLPLAREVSSHPVQVPVSVCRDVGPRRASMCVSPVLAW
eukprot:CAMPEP_0170570348 /NCGR_PEP_ID=MMETSP0224-20130122/1057_1 /TAXON_ID=285029 /ORGANISM="Togula jolla, Strain CCCM 725" /LENGTH=278 /DNA_ID=CAMNT_0010892609 /DNA_START=100 /DNA_END=933 /DNA_ORIENTATION=+